MADFHCFIIAFPNLNLDSYFTRSKKVKARHHVHLYFREKDIELRIFYDDQTYFGDKLSSWAGPNWSKFNKHVKTYRTKGKSRLLKVDLSKSKLISITNSTSQYENQAKFVSIYIDSIKCYWVPHHAPVNTAEFYFDEAGYNLVDEFYGGIFGTNGNFEIPRYQDMDKFYQYRNIEFRPEFDFPWNTDNKKHEHIITREPKLNFIYKKNISEHSAIKFAEIIAHLASFYYHNRIEYRFIRIHLKKYTITVRNIKKDYPLESVGKLWEFQNNWSFDKLLESSSIKELVRNEKVLFKVIDLFVQSFLVDTNSQFLIRYNIIEILSNNFDRVLTKIDPIVDTKLLLAKREEALNILLETVDKKDYSDFKIKWQNALMNLYSRPMESSLIKFLELLGIDTAELPIEISQLYKLRNDITHGSINKLDYEYIKKVNIFLYRICGIAILKKMGVSDYGLNKHL